MLDGLVPFEASLVGRDGTCEGRPEGWDCCISCRMTEITILMILAVRLPSRTKNEKPEQDIISDWGGKG